MNVHKINKFSFILHFPYKIINNMIVKNLFVHIGGIKNSQNQICVIPNSEIENFFTGVIIGNCQNRYASYVSKQIFHNNIINNFIEKMENE